MTNSQVFQRRHFTLNDGDYGFAFVRWTLNVIAIVLAILIVSSAIIVGIVIVHTMAWWA